ncbi:RvY_11941-1 [Ramazzottius varieornatus]|uniref:RvY_11941-1 protein ( RvY_11941.1protein, RvY_11941.2 protein ) n=1 Tax=Ramazzottius varieornatus TaxID=947166 RepID=A0A1D1VM31_RAMVA|nr:RvY_11941-1 [Ramazzottius varieornatus]
MSSKHVSWTINGTNSTNTTDTAPDAGWNPLNTFGLFGVVAGIICNVSVLAIFLSRRSLRNSFGVYVVNLLINETILALVYSPLTMPDAYYHVWVLGYEVCIFVNFVGYTYETLIIWAHFLIAVNRIWALSFPFSYRTDHSTKVAVLLCGSVWLAMNVVYIPVTLLTASLNPGSFPNTWSCDIDTTGILFVFTEIGLFVTPMVLVIVSYPYVCYKSFFSKRKQRIFPQSLAVASYAHGQQDFQPSRISGGTVATITNPGAGAKKVKRHRICGRELNGSLTGFVTLTLMTLSVAICLLPKEAFFTYLIWAESEPPGVLDVADILQRLTTLFDPILIVLANTEIRKMLYRQCRRTIQ